MAGPSPSPLTEAIPFETERSHLFWGFRPKKTEKERQRSPVEPASHGPIVPQGNVEPFRDYTSGSGFGADSSRKDSSKLRRG